MSYSKILLGKTLEVSTPVIFDGSKLRAASYPMVLNLNTPNTTIAAILAHFNKQLKQDPHNLNGQHHTPSAKRMQLAAAIIMILPFSL